MSFSELFLAELSKEKQLTDRETEVFLTLFGEGKTRLEIAERLHVQESAVNTCLTGVYRKFGISESGPVKESRLKDELRRREGIWQNQRVDCPSHSAQSVSDQTKLSDDDSGDHHSLPSQDQDDLIRRVREHCRQKILDQHSRIRLLSGEEIEVNQLYVDVWLLNRSPRTYQVCEDKLLQTFDLRNDRLGLGDRIKRNLGFEVANANAKLLILGKPGSGKTNFLKHLAVSNSKFRF